MVLRRIGNKSKMAKKIVPHFYSHRMYIELFFGAGGLFFNKTKAQYNIMNDNCSEVFNLYQCLQSNKEELHNKLTQMPVHEDLWHYWRNNTEMDPVMKAVRFIMLSNFGLMGKDETLRFGENNSKQIALKSIDKLSNFISDVQFMNTDFRNVLKRINIKRVTSKRDIFIYADPPYLQTTNNYQSGRFGEKDCLDLFNLLQDSDICFAISEFDHPFIIDQAKKRGLVINTIGERRSINKRSTEILITNYHSSLKLF